MRVLTVRQPWAWAIIHGGKDVENRVRSLGPYRGPVAIHASSSTSASGHGVVEAAEAWRSWWAENGRPEGQRGHVIGVVDLVDSHSDEFCARSWSTNDHDDCDDWSLCSKWAMDDHHHLVLSNPRPLPRPIPATGRLGLWRPDDALLGAITEQLAEVA